MNGEKMKRMSNRRFALLIIAAMWGPAMVYIGIIVVATLFFKNYIDVNALHIVLLPAVALASGYIAYSYMQKDKLRRDRRENKS